MKALLAAIVLTLVPVKDTKPGLKRMGAGRYRLVNPLLQPIVARIDCGSEFEPLTVELPAGTAQEMEIRQPNGTPGLCYLDKWKTVP